ncbi:arrestin-related trafficking adapter 3/6 [Apiospora arundinis]
MSKPGTNPEESDDESSSTEGRDDRTLQKIRDNLGLMKLPEGKDPMREHASVPPPPAERSPMLDMPPKYEDVVGDPGQDGSADYFSRLADYGDGDSDEELNIEPSTEDLSAWAPISEEHSTDERNPGETSTQEQRLSGSHNPHVDDGRFDDPDLDSARIPPHSTQLDRQSMSTSKPPWFLSRVRDDRFRRQKRRSGSYYIGHH